MVDVTLGILTAPLAAAPAWLSNLVVFLQVVIGFSIIIFVHELGHFLAAKWVGIRVDRFAVGFGYRLFGYRRGEGLTFGNRPEYSADELAERKYGETDYCFKALPIGGYVKMLGQDDIIIDEKTGDMRMTDDPRAFTNRPVGKRMIVVSAGVIFNLLFAALTLMLVFLMGREAIPPKIGMIEPDSPAFGKLVAGDEVVAVDGEEIREFVDLQLAAVFADGEMALTVRRDGALLPEPIRVEPVQTGNMRYPQIGVQPMMSATITRELPAVDGRPNVRPGDRIIAVDGTPVESGTEVIERFLKSGGELVELTVERPTGGDQEGSETVTAYQRAEMLIMPEPGGTIDTADLLGMIRRRKIAYVAPDSPAEKAGFKPGDVIAEWGTVSNPLYDEIIANIQANVNQPIRVLVLRDGEEQTIEVTPRRPFSFFSQPKARVGVSFGFGENARALVADVKPDSPAAAAGLPRGARLLEIDGTPVETWNDVVDALFAAVGRTVVVKYGTGGDVATGRFPVPSSVVNEAGVPPYASILSIDGETEVELAGEGASGKKVVSLPAPSAVKGLLAERVGETVTVKYRAGLGGAETREVQFAVREDNLVPWQLRVQYLFDPTQFRPEEAVIHADGNPWTALQMGVHTVYRKVREIYMILQGLATREVGVENVAGPVGIFGVAMEQAKAGWSDLLFFLAFLSTNLAVINFLPFPVMDGGLMVFLIIEKIKGEPLSLKAQMISTMVGLATIIIIGLLVTIQDLTRLFG